MTEYWLGKNKSVTLGQSGSSGMTPTPEHGHAGLLIVNRRMYDNMSDCQTCLYIGVAFFT